MKKEMVAKASVVINASIEDVWHALVTPEKIHEYMFGTTVVSDFKEGSQIVWKGEYEGKKYEDKGEILKVNPEEEIKYSHFSPLSGKADKPENYHTVTIDLIEKTKGVQVVLMQDNNPDTKARDHSSKNWQMMLDSLKKYAERNTQ